MTLLFLASDIGGERLVLDLLVVLATAAIVALAMQRLRMAVVPAYLIAGILVGPYALGFVRSPENLRAISDLATILLMFGIGMQLHVSALKGNALALVGAGVGSTLLSTLFMWPAGRAFGLSSPGALAMAMALSVSSTAVVLRLLADRRELATPRGRLSLAILVIQDLMVLAMLALMPLLAQWAAGGAGGATGHLPSAAQAAAGADEETWIDFLAGAGLKIGGVAALIVFGKAVLPRLLAEAARGKATEVLMIVSLAAAIGAAVVTQAIGFSPELGAFLAGFLLSATPFRFQLSGQIGPLRDLFMAVFFTAVGMTLDPQVALDSWWIVLVGCGAMLALKAVAIGTTCWTVGATAPASASVGAYLAQAGEFSLVILAIAASQRIIGERQSAVAIAVVVLSLVATPGLVALGRQVAPRVCRFAPAPWLRRSKLRDESQPTDDEHAGDEPAGEAGAGGGGGAEGAPRRPARRKRVIVAGFGPVGRAVAEKLSEAGVDYTIVELNPSTVRTQGGLGRSIVFGDIASPEVLESAGLRHADAIVLTIPDEDAVLRACQTIRRLAPQIFIAARTDFLSRGMLARGLGADYVIADEIASAEAMRVAVLDRLGYLVEKTEDQAKRASVSLRSTRFRK